MPDTRPRITFEYGGVDDEETYSARSQVENGVASGVEKEELLGFGLDESDLAMFDAPIKEELEKLDPIYLSYFVPWNSMYNYEFAKSRGFQNLDMLQQSIIQQGLLGVD